MSIFIDVAGMIFMFVFGKKSILSFDVKKGACQDV
jgi:hypothetical protein